jgi:hypothetical protein
MVVQDNEVLSSGDVIGEAGHVKGVVNAIANERDPHNADHPLEWESSSFWGDLPKHTKNLSVWRQISSKSLRTALELTESRQTVDI